MPTPEDCENALRETPDEELEASLKSLADKGLIEVHETHLVVTARGKILHDILELWGIEVWP